MFKFFIGALILLMASAAAVDARFLEVDLMIQATRAINNNNAQELWATLRDPGFNKKESHALAHAACAAGRPVAIMATILAMLPIDLASDLGMMLLVESARRGNVPVVKFLLGRGADKKAALRWCAMSSNEHMRNHGPGGYIGEAFLRAEELLYDA
jgi:hypothetical protein